VRPGGNTDGVTSFRHDLVSRVDAALGGFLSARRAEIEAAHPASAATVDELRRILDAGGKRLRPVFCYWGHRAAGGGDGDEVVRAAAALELVHVFAIVQDDVMDRSPLRHGQAATHLRLGQGHFGESAATLVGDLAGVLADQLFVESGFPPEALQHAFGAYNLMRVEVVVGQYADLLASAAAEPPGEDEARRIAILKSGGYTVEKPLAIGAALAGASAETLEGLAAYGGPLGEAFQLRDDVLGVFGDTAVMGKDAESDLREGKRTVLIAKARAMGEPKDVEFLDAHLGRADLSAAEVERLRDVLRRSGALDATLKLIDELHGRALDALDDAGFDAEVTAELMALAAAATARDG
jgi:geranylgeranyl diphosphate synthase, type I